MHRQLRVWSMGLGCLLLVACGSGGSDTPVETPTAHTIQTVAATQEVATTLSIQQIVWAEETDTVTGAPIETVDRFTTDSDAIMALVQVNDLLEGTEFVATWTLNDVPLIDADMSVIADDDMEVAWIAFRFTRDESRLYPIGQLGVTITCSDGTLRESSITIEFP